MTRLRLAAPAAVAAVMTSLVGSSLAPAQPGRYQQPYPQSPAAQYGQYQQPASTPPMQPQTTPYQASGQPMGGYRLAQQQPLVQQQPAGQQQPTSVASNYGSYQLPNYQLPNYQAPAPTQQAYQPAYQAPTPTYQAPAPDARYAMNHDEADATLPTPPAPTEQVPNPNGGDNNPYTGQQGDWENYVQAPAAAYPNGGCETGACNTDAYGAACDYGTFGGGGHGFGKGLLGGGNACRQWFFGAYSLFMTRDNPSYAKYAVLVDTPASYPYYPTHHETILSSDDVEPDWQWGAEIRLGSTFGTPSNCEGRGLRPYAWEVVYWGLAEDDNSSIVTDGWSDTDRLYSTINYSGLQYDRDGAGGPATNRPMNDYFDYKGAMDDPAYDPDTNNVRILGMRARNTFSAQNLELNFIRFPLAACNSCDPCSPPRFTINGTCGVRYMKLDEDWQLANQFTTVDGGGVPEAGAPTGYSGFGINSEGYVLIHDIMIDNELTGFQFGSNMNWLIGCKWSAFCDTQVGIYGNRISSCQGVWGGGEATWANSGAPVFVKSDKTDVSFLGEMRAGIGYQVGCNCRITTAYRVVAITGVALANDNISTDWDNPDYVGIIDSNDSLVLHGLQTGVEWKF